MTRTIDPAQVIECFVPGKPAPQGSKRYVGNGTSIESSKRVKPWRADIREHLLARWDGPPLDGPVIVRLEFVMPRPASTPKRSTPPAVKRPDLDKLTRAVLDAIGSAGVWGDDSQVVTLRAHKRIAAAGEATGVMIHLSAAVSAGNGQRGQSPAAGAVRSQAGAAAATAAGSST